MARIQVQPNALDLVMYAGDGFSMALTFTDETGNPWDATGIWIAQVRTTAAGTAVTATFAANTSEAGQGRVTLSLTGDEVRAIPSGAVWDVEQTVNGIARTWYRGKITVTQDVTRAVG